MSSFAGKFMSDLSKAKDKALKELDKVKAQADKYLNMESTTDRTKKDDVKERSRQLVADDVYLYTTKTKDPVSFLFELGADKKAIKVTLNFAGSENFKALDAKDVPANDLRLTGTVAPHERQILGSMVQINRKNAGKLCMDYSWEFVEPDRSTIKASVNENQERVAKLLEKQHSTPTQEGHFIDLAFPPCEGSLYTVNTLAGEGEGECEKPDDEVLVWHRPDDFMGGKYDVFLGGIEPGDICQGSLGDCWFLCSLACLGEFPEMVESLFLDDSRQISPSGRYNIRLCHYGDWETITVDDFFPCYPNGGPVYARGHDNELWVLLLEKAYAKLCGSYAALKSGWAYEAMIDLTGSPYTTIRFEDPDTAKSIADGSLWQKILQFDSAGYLQSASTPGEDTLTVGGERRAKDASTGLVGGHAYAFLRAVQTHQGHKLVEMRNPWGQGGMEWSGDWSDKSPLWTEALKEEVHTQLKDDDGAFWMSFEDFLENFYSINVCMVKPPKGTPGNGRWFETRERFNYTMTDGGGDEGRIVSAPSYVLTVRDRNEHVYVSVHQKDTRCVGSGPYVDIGVTVLKFNDATQKYDLIGSTGNSSDRQNQTESMCLEPGQYLVLPTSTGCKLRLVPGQVTPATIVIHSTCSHKLETKPFNPEAFEEAIELPILKYGVKRVLDPSKITLYTRKSGFSGVSYVIKNEHTKTLKFTQDCSVGKNIVSHRGTLSFEVTVLPGHSEVLHHIMPDDRSSGWQSGFSASYDWV